MMKPEPDYNPYTMAMRCQGWTPEQIEKMRNSKDFELPLTIHWGQKVYWFRPSYFWARVWSALLLLAMCVFLSLMVYAMLHTPLEDRESVQSVEVKP